MGKKVVEIPFPRHIAKFAQKRLGDKSGIVQLDTRVLILPDNRRQLARYRSLEARGVRIRVETHWANSIPHHVGIVDLFEEMFAIALYTHVETVVKMRGQAMDALREFCRQYNIEEDDYRLETFYRQWQRHKKRNKWQ
jgi:hypothetical protein